MNELTLPHIRISICWTWWTTYKATKTKSD